MVDAGCRDSERRGSGEDEPSDAVALVDLELAATVPHQQDWNGAGDGAGDANRTRVLGLRTSNECQESPSPLMSAAIPESFC
jgi:hypothetical protein